MNVSKGDAELSETTEDKQPVPAVAAVIIREGNILLVKRGVEPSKDMWSIPGGSVHWGEPLQEAVKREVREETGLEIEVGRIAGVFDLIARDEAGKASFHYVIVDFLAEPVGGTLRAGDDASEARWVPVEEVDSYELSAFLLSRLKQMRVI